MNPRTEATEVLDAPSPELAQRHAEATARLAASQAAVIEAQAAAVEAVEELRAVRDRLTSGEVAPAAVVRAQRAAQDAQDGLNAAHAAVEANAGALRAAEDAIRAERVQRIVDAERAIAAPLVIAAEACVERVLNGFADALAALRERRGLADRIARECPRSGMGVPPLVDAALADAVLRALNGEGLSGPGGGLDVKGQARIVEFRAFVTGILGSLDAAGLTAWRSPHKP